MTYDERQEIGEYLNIVKKNCERAMRSIDMMQNALGEMKCEIGNKDQKKAEDAKENFIKGY